VIVVVLVVVVGPKELPGVLRTFGTWMAKARSLSREFQNNMNQLAREVDREKVKVATPPPKATAVEPDPTGAAPSAAGDKAKVGAASAETGTTEPATTNPATTNPNIAGTSAAKLVPEPAATEAASEIPATPEDELKAAANTGAAKDDEGAATVLASEGSIWAAPGPPPNPGILTTTPPADLTASGGAASKSNGSGRAKDSAVDEPVLAASPSSVGER